MKGRESLIRRLLMVVAFSSLSLLALIAVFIFAGGIPIMVEVGPVEFLAGTRWAPIRGHFGILPMIVGSLWVTTGALVLGVPVALACAIYLSELEAWGGWSNRPWSCWRGFHRWRTGSWGWCCWFP